MRFGIIGTSSITEEFVDGLKRVKEQVITACYSRTEERAKTFIERNGIANAVAFTNFETMLHNIDAVYIASPNGLHFKQAKFFLENKKHVLLEKPLTFTKEEAQILKELANENGVILMEAFKPLHLPQFKEIKKWVSEKQAFLANFVLNQYSSRMSEINVGLYRSVFDAKLGKGSTYDLLVYPVGLAIALFGEVKNQQSYTYRLENGVGITNLVSLEFMNGTFVNITSSKAARGVVASEIIGIGGATLTFTKLTRLSKIRFYELDAKVPVKEFKGSGENPFVFEINEFVKIVEAKDFKKMNEFLELSIKTIGVLEKVENQH